MLDPISVLGIATTAFNTLKKGFQLGKDAESMIKDVGRFMHSVDDIKNAHKKKKTGKFGSVEEESLETYVALKKAKQMEDELRNFMNANYGLDAWNDILRIQARLRKERKEAIARAKKERETLIMYVLIAIGGVCSLWVVFYIIWKAMGK